MGQLLGMVDIVEPLSTTGLSIIQLILLTVLQNAFIGFSNGRIISRVISKHTHSFVAILASSPMENKFFIEPLDLIVTIQFIIIT